MRFGSVCSGIEAASVAWEPLGWKPAWFSEIAPFPSRVLAHHFPEVRNHGSLVGLADRLVGRDREIDILVGGTPCQSFSIAGLGGGLSDDRGNLALEYCRVAAALRPTWCLWENVPNVLSKKHAADFASIVGALVELGYGLAWRVLDARHFGVPQRRRRVFLVASLRGAAAAGSVLFEPEGLQGDPDQGRSKGKAAPAGTLRRVARSALLGVAGSLKDSQRTPNPTSTLIATNAEGSDGLTLTTSNLSKTVNNPTPLLLSFDPTQVTHPENRSTCDGRTAALAKSARPPHIAYSVAPETGQGADLTASEIDIAPALTATAEASAADRGVRVVDGLDGSWRVRRLTPLECERLQGFPEGWTSIEGASDSPRYAALGNSMAVPVMRWIGARIQAQES